MEIGDYLAELADGSKKLRVGGLQRLSNLVGDERKTFDAHWPDIDVRRRRRLVQELIDLAEDDAELDFDAVFLRGLNDEDPEVRLESVRGLWEYESPGLIASLVDLLENDDDPAVRSEAALALGRFIVMYELGRLRENHYQRAEAGLRHAIEKTDEVEEVRARAIEAIGPRDVPWVRQVVREAYESGEHRLKVSAVHAMGRSCENRWLPLITKELSSDEAELRYEAAIAAGTIADESIVPQLLPLLTDEDSDAREAAIHALGEIGGSQARTALSAMLDSDSDAVREAAAAALAAIEFEEDPLASSSADRTRGRAPVENATSSGGIVYRQSDRGTEVVICGRTSDGVWGLPKGTPNDGETLEQTAVREVSEETGLHVTIIEKIGVVEYWFARSGVRYHKWVHYYLMESTGGDTSNHDLEYDKVEWRTIPDALRTLTFRNEANMLDKAREMIRARK